ncbi:MAG: copper chaperone PCu(A)C [Pseudoxanthomonas sp.]
MKNIVSTLALFALCACSSPVTQSIGELHVSGVWSKATPPNAPVAAGFLTIDNRGDAPDRLLRVESAAGNRVEIHQMSQANGVARMREIVGGLPLPAGQVTELKPGGYHLMFIQPTQPFTEGGSVPATLVFEKAGRLPVVFEVRAMTAGIAQDGSKHH